MLRAMPAVSVVMVFHRDTPFLRPAIASVLQQTWRDLELVLVDNGTGLSAEALGPLGVDPRLRWIRLDRNEGIAAGHNAGVAAVGSPFAALLDYDDLMLPCRLERQLARLRAEPRLGLLGAGATTINQDGQRIGREFCVVGVAAHQAYSAWHSGAITPSLAGRTEVFRAFPYRPEFRWSADFDFVARVAERHAMDCLPEVLIHYRRHAGQTTREQRAPQIRDECLVRLLTARRRAGREESLVASAEAVGLAEPGVPDLVALHAAFGARCLQERFAAQAMYHARRIIATSRAPAAILTATRLAARSIRTQPSQMRFLLQLFFRGPVRALGLSDAGPSLSEIPVQPERGGPPM
jgi:hypothetical protein